MKKETHLISIRFALFGLAVSLGSCGDDDPPPAAPQDPVLRPSGELMPFDLSAIVPIDSVRAMAPGTPLYLRTEFAHGELADLEMRLVQVIDDFLAPMPIIMVEASDPVLIQLGGIAQGMSGSPVFTEEGTLGAIAYGFGAQDSPPYYFFATPIEWVIGSRGTLPAAAKAAATWEGARITPLEIPLVSTGGPGPRSGGGFLDRALSAGLTREPQASFEPGRPLTVGLLLGEITGGAMGTISYVEGDRVYGFGHPFRSLGPVGLPIIEARVLGEISNLSIPFKFATLNPTVRGTLTEDRLPAVRGVLGEEPDLVPIRSTYTFPGGEELELTHRMATVGLDPYTRLDLISSASFNPLYNRVDDDPDHHLRVTTNVAFSGTDSLLARTRLYASPQGRLFSLIGGASYDLSGALAELLGRNDYPLQVTEAEVHIEIIPESGFAQLADVSADTTVSPGSTLTVTALLRVGLRTDRDVELELALPDTLFPGLYLLEVAAADRIEDFEFLDDSLLGFDSDIEDVDAVFERLNAADKTLILKARLSFFELLPFDFEEFEEFDEGEDVPDEGNVIDEPPSFPDFPDVPPSVSAQEEIGLFIEGHQTLQVMVE